ncbi:MAG: YkgJ family cysteine cluster protein [Planctomycetota bacterium]
MSRTEPSPTTSCTDGTPLGSGPLASLRSLYVEVDHRATQIADGHGARLQCRRGCCQCCVDDLTVFEIEAENIRLTHASLLAELEPHERGACAFLDAEGGCRIYADRPYVCRTQGLPLRWIDEGHDGELVELRDICPLNDEGTPIVELAEDECWTIGPAEERLASLQHQFRSGQMTRVPLRSLFSGSDSKAVGE